MFELTGNSLANYAEQHEWILLQHNRGRYDYLTPAGLLVEVVTVGGNITHITTILWVTYEANPVKA